MLQQLDGFAAKVQPRVTRKGREAFAVHLHHIKFLKAKPLRGELASELPEARVGDHAGNLRVQLAP